jgi:hypothetical protein
MADKLVALLGPGEGPRLFTGRMQSLVAKVQGLTDGVVSITHDAATIIVESGGEFPVPDSRWIQFHHVGKSKTLICTIQSKAHALHTAGPSDS